MKRWTPLLLIFTVLCFLTGNSAIAKDATVYVVLFYSPTCFHCEKLEKEFLPKLQEQFGKKLVIVHVNVISSTGGVIYEEAIRLFKIPESRIRVPAMIIGETFLVGTSEIPEKLPNLIKEALSKGGANWPELKGLREEFFAQKNVHIKDLSMWQFMMFKFKQDPLANGLSVTVFLFMVISLIASTVIALSSVKAPKILIAFPLWIIPPLVGIGLILAGYLSFVEVSEATADCGPVGNCNAVQSSPYAKLFGVVPIAFMGIGGYLAILVAWFFQQFGRTPLKRNASLALWALVTASVLFSSYLTFLEPFVLGATCTFCLTSAIVLTLTLWASILPAKKAMRKTADNRRPLV